MPWLPYRKDARANSRCTTARGCSSVIATTLCILRKSRWESSIRIGDTVSYDRAAERRAQRADASRADVLVDSSIRR